MQEDTGSSELFSQGGSPSKKASVEQWKGWIQRQISMSFVEYGRIAEKSDVSVQAAIRDLRSELLALRAEIELSQKQSQESDKKYYEYAKKLEAEFNESQRKLSQAQKEGVQASADKRLIGQALENQEAIADVADFLVVEVFERGIRWLSRAINFTSRLRARHARPVDQLIERNRPYMQKPSPTAHRRRSTDRKKTL